LLYISDLPGSINNLSKPTLFAYDTNIIITHSNLKEFKEEIKIVFEKVMEWFQINLLSLNLAKTHYMQFMSKANCPVEVNINYKPNTINNIQYTHFVGLTLDSTLSWESHLDQLVSIWGNSTHSNTIFKIQKRVIRIMVNVGTRETCRELFKKLNIFPL
jgi:hypothetical protein